MESVDAFDQEEKKLITLVISSADDADNADNADNADKHAPLALEKILELPIEEARC